MEIWADDPAAGPDLAAWCRMRGQELLVGEPPRFVVKRTTEPQRDVSVGSAGGATASSDDAGKHRVDGRLEEAAVDRLAGQQQP